MNEDEIICSCIGTTVKDIMDAMDNGAKTIEDIEEVTQAGTVCGACIGDIEALMEKLKK